MAVPEAGNATCAVALVDFSGGHNDRGCGRCRVDARGRGFTLVKGLNDELLEHGTHRQAFTVLVAGLGELG